MSRRLVSLNWIVLSTVLAVVACSQSKPVLRGGPGSAADYEKALERWTRHEKVYHRLASRLFVTATYQSPQFLATYNQRYAEIFSLSEEEVKIKEAEAEKILSRHHEFFFTAATPVRRWNDFSSANSIWRVTLVNDRGREVSPTTLQEVKKTPNLQALYPYLNDFALAYRVQFPRRLADGTEVMSPTDRYLTLKFASALGKTELRWELK